METNSDLRTQLVDTLSHVQQPWESTPEDFYIFTFLLHSIGNMEIIEKDLSDPVNCVLRYKFEAFAKHLMQVFSVDLSPWSGIGDMIDNGDFRDRFREVIDKIAESIEGMFALQEVIEDTFVDPSEETQEKWAESELYTEILMKRMGMFFTFKGQ